MKRTVIFITALATSTMIAGMAPSFAAKNTERKSIFNSFKVKENSKKNLSSNFKKGKSKRKNGIASNIDLSNGLGVGFNGGFDQLGGGR